jgi:uncharacterized protein with GYD domain
MATFLVQFTYTEEGLKGVRKEGGSKRREATEQLVKSLGGKLLAFYFAFGKYDGVAIIEMPENADTAAAGFTISASGAARTNTTVLLTPEEIDRAVKKSATYRAPGK